MIEFEIVKTFYLERIELADEREEPIKLKMEILKSLKSETYYPRLFRLETYDVKASFGTKETWGKEILVRDGHIDWDEISCSSVEAVIETVKEILYPD